MGRSQGGYFAASERTLLVTLILLLLMSLGSVRDQIGALIGSLWTMLLDFQEAVDAWFEKPSDCKNKERE